MSRLFSLAQLLAAATHHINGTHERRPREAAALLEAACDHVLAPDYTPSFAEAAIATQFNARRAARSRTTWFPACANPSCERCYPPLRNTEGVADAR
jgi:hypothetical protein